MVINIRNVWSLLWLLLGLILSLILGLLILNVSPTRLSLTIILLRLTCLRDTIVYNVYKYLSLSNILVAYVSLYWPSNSFVYLRHKLVSSLRIVSKQTLTDLSQLTWESSCHLLKDTANIKGVVSCASGLLLLLLILLSSRWNRC